MNKIIKHIQGFGIIFIFFGVLLFIGIFITNTFSYFDPLSMCYISIKSDIIRGNEKTIHQALTLIKKRDKEDYNTVCKYISIISEKNYCKIGDGRVDSSLHNGGFVDPPCYIKGSKTMYLKSEKNESDNIVIKRAEDIIKYANHSKTFWEGL
ncbi:MAG: hypothetical protein Q8P20_08215 [bacterium]|nr:hypothetical protein [bacterium]